MFPFSTTTAFTFVDTPIFFDELGVEPIAYVGIDDGQDIIIDIGIARACGRYMQTNAENTYLFTPYEDRYLRTICS